MAKNPHTPFGKDLPTKEGESFPLRCLPAPYHDTRLDGLPHWPQMVSTAFHLAAMEVLVWDFTHQEFLCSQGFCERLGLEEGSVLTELLPEEERAAFFQILRQARETGNIQPRRIRWSLPGFSPRVLAIQSGMFEREGEEDAGRVLLLAQDVSLADTAVHALRDIYQKADERVALSNTLLREVNHRLKNNLQIVCSLIHSHGDGLSDPKAKNSFRDIETRVRMIAHLHDLLARGFDTLEASAILRELAKHIAQSGALPASRLELDLEEGTFELAPARAMPFAMAANELLMNSIQHGTPGTPVAVLWRGSADGSGRLTIRNSCDAPSGKRHSGLGTEIVHALCRQLEARFQSDFSWNQAVCHLVIPATKGGPDA